MTEASRRPRVLVDLDELIDALAHLTCGTNHTSTEQGRYSGAAIVPPREFSGFEIFRAGAESALADLNEILLPDNFLDCPLWPFDVTVASKYPTGDDWEFPRWQFSRVRSLDLKEWRGKLMRAPSPKMFDMAVMIVAPDGRSWTRRYALAPEGSRLRLAGYPFRKNWPDHSWMYGDNSVTGNAELEDTVRCAIGLSLRRRYYWSVLIREDESPEARFLTDLEGAREAFRLRDVPAGKRRRAALRHWVADHWRQSRPPREADEVFIREHLRGATAFDWNGLRCRFEPSDVDAERLELSKSRVVLRRAAS
jgi:hypothetical protein